MWQTINELSSKRIPKTVVPNLNNSLTQSNPHFSKTLNEHFTEIANKLNPLVPQNSHQSWKMQISSQFINLIAKVAQMNIAISPPSKIFQTLMKNKLMSYLDKDKILSDSQYGFRSGINTYHAICNFSHLYWSLDIKLSVLSIFVDCSKTSHSVNHNILLQKITSLWYERHYTFLVQHFFKC